MVSWLNLATALLVAANYTVAAATSSPGQRILTPETANGQPNIIFILADDQDLHMNSLEYMPHLKHHLLDQGTFYQRHYCTIALCCPSRVSLWTGRAAHNTNVTDVNPPYGGYPKFVSQGFNEAWLPLWLQEAGYNTYYTGKLFNAHTVNNYDSPYPSGFNGSDFLLDPYTYQYLNASFQRNQDPPVSYEGQYSTDVLASKAYGFLDEAIAASQPFFLTIAPNAPHSNVGLGDSFGNGTDAVSRVVASPPIPAERHRHLFKDVTVPRTPNFNPDTPSGVSWIASLPQLNQSNIDFNDHFYRSRLRALQAVDEIVDGVFKRLEDANILDSTYIFYSSDNGYHISQHRLQPGKECGFEEDINVPLIVRGPGVPEGKVSDAVTSHTDLAPTFLSLAGGKIRDDFDGTAIPVKSSDLGHPSFKDKHSEHVNIEYWGFALSEGKFDPYLIWNNTYKGLRLIGPSYNFYYSVWCNGEHQLYDLNTDPYELDNLYLKNHSSQITLSTTSLTPSTSPASTPSSSSSTSTPTLTLPISKLLTRLDALLLILKTCKSHTCTHPWSALHAQNNVHNLLDALDDRYDAYYEVELAGSRVRFDRCEQGFILDAEGPVGEDVLPFGWEVGPRGGAMWHELV